MFHVFISLELVLIITFLSHNTLPFSMFFTRSIESSPHFSVFSQTFMLQLFSSFRGYIFLSPFSVHSFKCTWTWFNLYFKNEPFNILHELMTKTLSTLTIIKSNVSFLSSHQLLMCLVLCLLKPQQFEWTSRDMNSSFLNSRSKSLLICTNLSTAEFALCITNIFENFRVSTMNFQHNHVN